MTDAVALQPLDAAWQSLREGDWAGARALFEAALAREESARALEGLGWCGYFLDDVDLTLSARKRAYQCYLAQGERGPAARVAAWLAADYLEFRDEPAVSNGWLQRARRLVSDLEPSADHAWVAVHEASFVLEDDPARARELGALAVDVGRAQAVVELEVLGLAIQGLALVVQGEQAAGMAMLDEAVTAGLAEPAELLVCIAWAGCYLVSACELVRDYDRARQWCDRIAAYCERHGIGMLLGVCRAKYAGVLVWQGRWPEAEEQLLAAQEQLEASRSSFASLALVRLADLRRVQGDLDEALRLYAACGGMSSAVLGAAEVALEQGRAEEAVDLAERSMRRMGDPSRLDRAGGLELLVRGLVALGQVDAAHEPLAELRAIADRAGSAALRASALAAEGTVAAARQEGDRARRLLEDAVDLATTSPYLAARIRLDLAEVLARHGRRGAAEREARTALHAFEGLGAARAASRALGILGRLRTPAGAEEAGPLGALSPREREVLLLVAEGLTNAEVARRLVLSEHTVHRHVNSILRKLGVPTRAAAAALASRHTPG